MDDGLDLWYVHACYLCAHACRPCSVLAPKGLPGVGDRCAAAPLRGLICDVDLERVLRQLERLHEQDLINQGVLSALAVDCCFESYPGVALREADVQDWVARQVVPPSMLRRIVDGRALA